MLYNIPTMKMEYIKHSALGLAILLILPTLAGAQYVDSQAQSWSFNNNQNNYVSPQYITGVSYNPNSRLSITTNRASNITKTSATLSFTVSGASDAVYAANWGDVPQLGETTQYVRGTGNVTVTLNNLTPGRTYYFRGLAMSSYPSQTAFGDVLSFTTLNADGSRPSGSSSGTSYSGSSDSQIYGSGFYYGSMGQFAHTLAPTDITKYSAMLRGTINSQSSGSTSYRFEYGFTPSLGLSTGSTLIGSTDGDAVAAYYCSGVGAGETYDYRLVAQNGNNTAYGEIIKFSTKSVVAAKTTTGSGSSNSASNPASVKPTATTNTSGNSLLANLSKAFGFSKTRDCVAMTPAISDAKAAPGQEVIFTVAYKNVCDLNLNNSILEITMPAGIDLLDSSAQYSAVSGNSVSYRFNIPSRSTGEIRVRGKLQDTLKKGAALRYAAVVQYQNGDGAMQNEVVAIDTKVGGSLFSWFGGKSKTSSNNSANVSSAWSWGILNLILILMVISFVVFLIIRNRNKPAPLSSRIAVQ